MMTSGKNQNKSLAEILTLRSKWEYLVADYKLQDYNGTIDNLRWFAKYGVRSNRFRPNFEIAVQLAKDIISEVDGYEDITLSSIHR